MKSPTSKNNFFFLKKQEGQIKSALFLFAKNSMGKIVPDSSIKK